MISKYKKRPESSKINRYNINYTKIGEANPQKKEWDKWILKMNLKIKKL